MVLILSAQSCGRTRTRTPEAGPQRRTHAGELRKQERKARNRGGRATLRGMSTSQMSLLAASSLGKWPRVLMILRNRLCTLSMALVTGMILPGTPSSLPLAAYGASIRDRGTWEHEAWAGRFIR